MSSKQYRVALVGARADGQAGVALDVLSYYSKYSVTGFFDSTTALKGKSILGIPIVGSIEESSNEELQKYDFFHISIGDNKGRLDTFQLLKSKGCRLLTLMHPSAIISKNTTLGEGCFIGANAVIQNGCNIGDVCLFNTGSITEHDNIIGQSVHLAPNSTTGGRVQVKDLAFIGIGATILPDIVISKSAFIGAGTTINKDVEEDTTMIGHSARIHVKNIYQNEKLEEK